MALSLEGKVAIVTGGARGIGEAVSFKFATLGATVVVVGLPGDPVPEVVGAIKDRGGKATAWIGDIGVEGQAEECVSHAVEEHGRLDVLVNLHMTPLEAIETEHLRTFDFDRAIYANVRSVFLMTHFALPHLKEAKGVVLSAGSEHGIMGLGLNPAHAATRAWVHAFMRGIAQEAAPWGVRANSVCPGPVDTAFTHSLAELDPELENRLVAQTPLGRRGLPEEVANVYAFLASDEASFVTGALYSADGGLSAGPPTAEIKRDREPPRRSADASP